MESGIRPPRLCSSEDRERVRMKSHQQIIRSVNDEAGKQPASFNEKTKNMRQAKNSLIVILLFYLAASIVNSRLVPTGQTGYQNAPDEEAHVHYIQSLYRGHLPSIADQKFDRLKQSYEWHQPPLYYLVELPFLKLGVHAMRSVSIGLGCLSILLIFFTALQLFPDSPWIAVSGSGVAAFTPGFISINSAINNDSLLIVLFSLFFLTLTILFKNNFPMKSSLFMGAIIGAAILTKGTGILLVFLFAASVLIQISTGNNRKKVLISGTLSIIFCALISGWWFLLNQVRFHQLIPFQAFSSEFQGTAQASTMAYRLGGWGKYWQLAAIFTFQSYWAVYGTKALAHQGIPAFLPEQAYLLPLLICIGSIYGMFQLHIQRAKLFSKAQLHTIWILMVSIVMLFAAYAAFLSHYFQTQGRYLYPAILPISLFITIGWGAIFPERYKTLAVQALPVVFFLITLIFLTAVWSAS